jgi:hypothetical protein
VARLEQILERPLSSRREPDYTRVLLALRPPEFAEAGQQCCAEGSSKVVSALTTRHRKAHSHQGLEQARHIFVGKAKVSMHPSRRAHLLELVDGTFALPAAL